MNERIKELAEQAGFQWLIGLRRNNPIITGQETTVQEFAELIVRECADAAYQSLYEDRVFDDSPANIRRNVMDAVKKHFGVEE